MKTKLLTLTLALASLFGFSQTFIHHSADDCVFLNVTPNAAATYTASVANPDTVNPAADPNTSTNVSSTLSAGVNNALQIALPAAYAVGDPFTFNFRFYSANAGSNNNGSGRIIVRMINSTLGGGSTTRINLSNTNKVGGEWEDYTYSVAELPDNADGTIDANGGFDQITLIPSNGAVAIETLYIDDIELNIDNTPTPLSSDATLNATNQWYYNNSPDAFNTTVAGWGGGTDVLEAQATPTTTGNSSPTVLKFTRNDLDATTGIKFDQGPNFDYNSGDGKITVRIYPECNLDYGTPTLKIRTRFNGAAATQIQHDTDPILTANQWNEVILDLTDPANQETSVATDDIYNEVYLIFNQGVNIDTAGNPAVFYIDALQVPEASALSTNDFELNSASISVYPNPVTNSFQIDSNINNIESVKLYNITGRLLKTFSEEVNYDISDLATGIYIANIKTQLGSKTLKIVKK